MTYVLVSVGALIFMLTNQYINIIVPVTDPTRFGAQVISGIGFYVGAIIGILFSVFALISLKRIDVYIKKHARSMDIYIEYNQAFSLRCLSKFER